MNLSRWIGASLKPTMEYDMRQFQCCIAGGVFEYATHTFPLLAEQCAKKFKVSKVFAVSV